MDEINEITDLDELRRIASEAATEGRGLFAEGRALTPEELERAETLLATRNAANERIATLEAENAETETRTNDLRDAFGDAEDETEAEAEAAEEAPEAEVVEEQPEAVAASAGRAPTTTEPRRPKTGTATAPLPAKKRARPEVPVEVNAQVSLVASADFAGIAAMGSDVTLDQAGQMLVKRARSFSAPRGGGDSMVDPEGHVAQIQKFPVLSMSAEYDDDFTYDGSKELTDVLNFASKETNIPGQQGLTAAGWCAPSEQLYDLCFVGETLDGRVNLPEVQAKRAGLKYFTGPDFAALYAAIGFHQTEAQAIADTPKPCYTVPCPAPQEVRLDVEGVCIKVPILTQAAFPEIVNRILSGAATVHAHKMSAFKIAKMEAGSSAKTALDLGSTAESTLRALELRIAYQRQVYRMSEGQTLETVVPMWVKVAVKRDLALRSGLPSTDVVTDAVVAAHFASIGANVQFVWGWAGQDLVDAGGATDLQDFPATFKALLYPAGTFVALTNNVIDLGAIYDAASLSTNTYTGTFSEEGIAVAKMCGLAQVITIPTCSMGTTGANEFTCTTTP